MVEDIVKQELLNELDNSDNVVEHYPTVRKNENNESINELVLFYSKKQIFRNKIYIVQLDRFPIISSDFPEPFDSCHIDKAVTDLVEKHHEITKIDTDDIGLNLKLIENDWHINHLYFSENSLKNEIQRIRLLIENLK